MKKRVEAYFSVEAAMILPMVISAILLVAALFIFQYNRCLMEQDMAAYALKGAAMEADSNEAMAEKMQKQAAGLYRDKYVAWDLMVFEVKMKKGIVEALGQGSFRFVMPGWNLWNGENTWSAQAAYKAHRISPVDFIRNCCRIKGGK